MIRSVRSLIAAVFAVAAAQPMLAHSQTTNDHEAKITITGCVSKGEGSGYLLKNVRLIEGTAPAGVSADRIYLRLNTTKGFKDHVGHQVNVMGEADWTDMDKGTLEVKTKDDGRVQVKLTSERKSVTSTLNPTDATVTAAPVGTSGSIEVPTYKMKVTSVNMVSATCS